jgi:chorismate mutase
MSEQSEPTEDGRTGQARDGVGHERQAPEEVARELRLLRDSIDNLDAALVFVLAERFKCTQKVGQLKARHDLPPADPEREAQQIRRLRRLAEESQLEPQFAEKFLNFIVEEVVRHHKLIAAGASPQGPVR